METGEAAFESLFRAGSAAVLNIVSPRAHNGELKRQAAEPVEKSARLTNDTTNAESTAATPVDSLLRYRSGTRTRPLRVFPILFAITLTIDHADRRLVRLPAAHLEPQLNRFLPVDGLRHEASCKRWAKLSPPIRTSASGGRPPRRRSHACHSTVSRPFQDRKRVKHEYDFTLASGGIPPKPPRPVNVHPCSLQPSLISLSTCSNFMKCATLVCRPECTRCRASARWPATSRSAPRLC